MARWKDLGLTYEEAAHGVQSAILARINIAKQHEWSEDPARNNAAAGPKHLRTGLDMSKAEMGALLALLIRKGVFTEKEWMEEMRLAANQELAMHEDTLSELMGGRKVSFR